MHHHPVHVDEVCDGQAYRGEQEGDRDLKEHQDQREDEVEEVDGDATATLPISVHVRVLKVDWREHESLKYFEQRSHYRHKC